MSLKKWLFLSATVFTVAFLSWFYGYRKKQSFEWVSLRTGTMHESIYGLGTVVAKDVYEHKIGVVANIRKLYVGIGDIVKKGQLLIEYDGVSPLYAPLSGTITHLPFHVNENVFPQVPILRIEDLNSRIVEVGLEQMGALRVRLGQTARLSFENLRGEHFTGKVASIFPYEGQFTVRIQPEGLPPEILPGMTTDVAIEVGRNDKALLLPAAAVSSGRITVLKDGKKLKRTILVGGSDGEWVEVLSNDLSTNDQVLVPKKRNIETEM